MEEHDMAHYPGHYRRSSYFAANDLQRILIISIVLSSIGAVQILLIPLTNINGSWHERLFAYAISGIFWVSIIVQVVLTVKAKSTREYLQDRGYRIKGIRHAPIGVVSFFKNTEAIVSDATLFVSAIVLAIIIWLGITTSWLIIICLSLLFLSFSLHCIFNGKNYRYNKAFKKFKKEHEQDE